MNFGTIGGMGGAVAGYLQTAEGQEAVKKFLASPQGIALLQNFAGSAEGKKTLMGVLPNLLSGLNLPAGTAETINGAIQSQQ